MPTILGQLDRIFRIAIHDAFGLESDAQISLSQHDKFGDYQSNAAMGLVKPLAEKTGNKLNPRAIAEQIKAKLQLGEMASEITIAGPGFINVRLAPAWLAKQTNAIVADPRLGVAPIEPQTIVIDYSGPNVAKEMHVGHLRPTNIGDAISRILEFQQNHQVIRQNHIGDWGTQFGRVVLAVWYDAVFRATKPEILLDLVARQQAASKAFAADKDEAQFKNAIAAVVRDIAPYHQQLIDEDPDGHRFFLPFLTEAQLPLQELENDYVFVSALVANEEATKVHIRHPLHGECTLAELPRLITTFIQNPGKSRNDQEALAWQKSRDVTLKACEEIYRRLDVKLQPKDVRGESFYNPMLQNVVDELKEAGVATESEGATVVWVKGYEAPLIIQKTGGGFGYATTDLAALRFRVKELHAQRIIYVTDARQIQHFNQFFAAAAQAGWTQGVRLDHVTFGMILGPDNKPFKTKSGENIKLNALLDEAEERAFQVVTEKNPEISESQRRTIAHAVGIGAVKYYDLARDWIGNYVFEWEKILALDGNTAPYLQYAHTRVRSIFRKAGDAKMGEISLQSPYELALAKHILRLGEVIDQVARELKPHHLCAYLYELATRFSGFFENCPVIQSEPNVRSSRLALCDLTAKALELGLDLLGIEHPDQM